MATVQLNCNTQYILKWISGNPNVATILLGYAMVGTCMYVTNLVILQLYTTRHQNQSQIHSSDYEVWPSCKSDFVTVCWLAHGSYSFSRNMWEQGLGLHVTKYSVCVWNIHFNVKSMILLNVSHENWWMNHVISVQICFTWLCMSCMLLAELTVTVYTHIFITHWSFVKIETWLPVTYFVNALYHNCALGAVHEWSICTTKVSGLEPHVV